MKSHVWCTILLVSGLFCIATCDSAPSHEETKRPDRLYVDRSCAYGQREEFQTNLQLVIGKLDARLSSLRRMAESSAALQVLDDEVQKAVEESEKGLADLRRRLAEIENATPELWNELRDASAMAVEEVGQRIFKAKRALT